MFNRLPFADFQSWFLQTPSGKEFLHAAESERHARRDELIAELTEARTAHAKRSADLAKTRSKAEAAVKKARDELKTVNAAWTAATSHAQGEAAGFRNLESKIIAQLKELAPAEVSETINRIEGEIDELTTAGKRADFDAARSRLEILRAARLQAGELVTAAKFDSELGEILATVGN